MFLKELKMFAFQFPTLLSCISVHISVRLWRLVTIHLINWAEKIVCQIWKKIEASSNIENWVANERRERTFLHYKFGWDNISLYFHLHSLNDDIRGVPSWKISSFTNIVWSLLQRPLYFWQSNFVPFVAKDRKKMKMMNV